MIVTNSKSQEIVLLLVSRYNLTPHHRDQSALSEHLAQILSRVSDQGAFHDQQTRGRDGMV